jgi:hypothetical protein
MAPAVDIIKKIDPKLRQSTLSGPRSSIGTHTGIQPGRPKTPHQAEPVETLPTIEEAMQFLIDNEYHKEGSSMSVTKLGEITLKICDKAKKEEHKHTMEVMKNIGVILIQVGKEALKFIVRGKKVDEAITELKEELAKTSEGQRQELEMARKAAEESENQAKKMMNRFAEGMETMTGKLKAMEETMRNRSHQAPAQTTTQNWPERPTYAATAANGISIRSHARAVARGEEAERQVVVTAKSRDKEIAAGLKTEKELIAKAEMTIKLMEEAGEKPPGHVKFIGGF